MPVQCKIGVKILGGKKLKPSAFEKPKQQFAKGTKAGLKAGLAGGFDFPTVQAGTSKDGRATVWVDPNLGQGGMQNATALLGWIDSIMAWHDALFGYKGGMHNVIVAAVNGATDGSGGAYHYGCDWTTGADLYVDTATGNPALVAGLYAAELSECFMGGFPPGQQASPWNCGFSNGEGLSRVCANETVALVGSPGAMEAAGFGAASSWNTADDWISQTEQTDQDYDSTGAAMVGIDWLRANGYPLYQIAQAPGDTLEGTYAALTGKSGFYGVLVAAVKALPGGVQSDYPFTGGPNPSGAIPGGGPSPPPPPGPPPPSAPWTGTIDPYKWTLTLTPGGTPAASDLRAALEKRNLGADTVAAILKLVADVEAGASGSTILEDLWAIGQTL